MPVVRINHDGARNAAVQITGCGPYDWETVLDLNHLKPTPREVRLDAVYYAVADGTQVELAWSSELERLPFLPLAGRGKVDFGEVSGIHNNCKGRTGHIELRVTGTGIFTVVLDLSKHTGAENG